MSIVYCRVCSLPPEYCEFDKKKFGQCKAWLERAHPDLFQELYGEGKEEEKSRAQPEAATEPTVNENEPSDNEDESEDEEDNEVGDDEHPVDDGPPPNEEQPTRRLDDDSENSEEEPAPQEKKKRRRRRPRKKGGQNAQPQETNEDGGDDDDDEDNEPPVQQNPNRRQRGGGRRGKQPPPQPASRRRVALSDEDDDEDSDGEDDGKARDDRKVRFQEPDERPARKKKQKSNAPKPKKYIGVSTVTRRGNKKLTVVRGLMEFGMKPKKAQSAFRKRFASGVGVNTTADGKEEIVIQGECRYDMMRFLHNKWKVPVGLLYYQQRDGTLSPGYTPEGMCLPPP